MIFLNLLVSIVSNVIFLYFLGIKFESKRGVNRTQKIAAYIIFTGLLSFLAIINVKDEVHFFLLIILYFIVMLVYLFLYKQGSLLEKVYWISLLECIGSCATFLTLLILRKISFDYFYPYIGEGVFVLAGGFLLFVEYAYLFCVTKVSPRLNYLGPSALICSVFVNFCWIIVVAFLVSIMSFEFSMIACIMLLLSYIVYFLIIDLLEKNVDKLSKVESEYQNMKLKIKYYEEIQLINQEVRKYRHDLANHLHILYYFIDTHDFDEAKQYLECMELDFNKINKSFHFIDTGNQTVDVILNSKVLVARKKGIDIKANIGEMADLAISNIDLCTLLANLLDNSIEACLLFEKENPFIQINMQLIKKNFIISIKNSSNPVKIDEKGNYITNKKVGDHGFGMLQINRIIKQYNGFISRNYENDVFETNILICRPIE